MITVGILLAVLQLTSCSRPSGSEPQLTTEGVKVSEVIVPGYTGGCSEGFTIYVQNQLKPIGSKIRRSLDQTGVRVGLRGNEELRAVGWTRTELLFYPENPPELQGTVWFYVPELPNGKGSGWLPDAGVRAVRTEPTPSDDDKYFDSESQSPPLPPECELFPR